MADLAEMVRYLDETGVFTSIVNNVMGQFGTPEQPYLGAELLPERLVPENEYTEESIRWRSVVANDGTRYSAVQKKGNTLVGSMKVSLGHQDIGNDLTARDYDALIRLMRQSQGTQGIMGQGIVPPAMENMIVQWADTMLARPLRMRQEQQRWQALLNAQVIRTGDDGYSETCNYPNPTGHRVTAGGTWSSNSYDPYPDIIAGVEFLAAKGYTVNSMWCGTDVRSKLSRNAFMVARNGKIIVNSSNAAVNLPAARASLEALNGIFSSDGLPALRLNDYQYRTQTTSGYYFNRGTLALFATTGRDESIDRADAEPLTLGNTLGYSAIGRPQGEAEPMRVIKTRVVNDRKPYRIEGEAWQASLPVITDPEAMFIISGIA